MWCCVLMILTTPPMRSSINNTFFFFHCKTGVCILFQKSKRCSTSHKNAPRASFWRDVASRATILPAFRFSPCFGNDLTACIWKALKHLTFSCLWLFWYSEHLRFFLFFFFSFEKRWASLSWCEAAIDFYLKAEVKGSLARSARLNVYWPVICHMVCIFKCARMSWDHLRAASFSGWAEIESRPIFVLRDSGAFLMPAACFRHSALHIGFL